MRFTAYRKRKLAMLRIILRVHVSIVDKTGRWWPDDPLTRLHDDPMTRCPSLTAYIPAPILFGSIIDTTCILWEDVCGAHGTCLMYDIELFRYKYVGKCPDYRPPLLLSLAGRSVPRPVVLNRYQHHDRCIIFINQKWSWFVIDGETRNTRIAWPIDSQVTTIDYVWFSCGEWVCHCVTVGDRWLAVARQLGGDEAGRSRLLRNRLAADQTTGSARATPDVDREWPPL